MNDKAQQPTQADSKHCNAEKRTNKRASFEGALSISQPRKNGLYLDGVQQWGFFSCKEDGFTEELCEFEDAVKLVLKKAGQELERRGYSIKEISMEIKAIETRDDLNLF